MKCAIPADDNGIPVALVCLDRALPQLKSLMQSAASGAERQLETELSEIRTELLLAFPQLRSVFIYYSLAGSELAGARRGSFLCERPGIAWARAMDGLHCCRLCGAPACVLDNVRGVGKRSRPHR